MNIQRSARLKVAAILVVACAVACSSTPPPEVALRGSAEDLEVLAGVWRGEYTSSMTGRSGTIRFTLESADASAFGDVLMIPQRRPGADGEPRSGSAVTAPQTSKTLTIRFVRVAGEDETVSGRLEPYEDPDCGCLLTTTFVGTVRDDFIEGTYTSRAGNGHTVTSGSWRVDRSKEDDESSS